MATRKFLLIPLFLINILPSILATERFTIEDYFIHKRERSTFTPTITVLAQQMDFYDKKHKIMNKVSQFMKQLENRMRQNVQELSRQGRLTLALNKEEEYFEIYELLNERFNRAFLKWDRYFVEHGDDLDRIKASEGEKRRLVNETLRGLETTINHIMETSKKQFSL